jgi:DNA-binding NarL/FixJ family response regulator
VSAVNTLRLMLVEDHIAFRQALAFLLNSEPDLEVVAQASSLAQAKEALLEEHPDVAVVDLALPDGDGTELFGELRRTNPDIGVVVLSATVEAGDVEEVLKAGADAVLDKVESPASIAYEVRGVAGR